MNKQEISKQIAFIESSNNPLAEAATSSATGLFQFVDSTWMNLVELYEPELLEDRSRGEVLELRKDPVISEKMFYHLMEENAGFLDRRGIEVTPGTLYLAHFLGIAKAMDVLTSRPEMLVVEVVGEHVIEANPFMQGYTVDDTVAWADRKMEG